MVKNIKALILITLTPFIISIESYADSIPQDEEIGYSYDLVGNRTGRKVIILVPPLGGEEGETTDDGKENANDSIFDAPPFIPPGGGSSMPNSEGNLAGGGNIPTNSNFEPNGQNVNSEPETIEQPETNSTNENATQINTGVENYSNAAMVDFMESRKVVIYPNPTQGRLKVELQGESDTEQIPVSIFDANGRLVFSQKMVENPLLIDLSGQVSGTYILKIDEGEQSSVWKIIKQ